MARQLFGFRNTRWWGSWKDAPAWELTSDIEAQAEALKATGDLGSGLCPICGEPLKKWSQPVDSAWLTIWGAKEYGNTGYYEIPHQEWNGGEMSPGALMRLAELEWKAETKPSIASYSHTPEQVPELRARIMSKHLERMNFRHNFGQGFEV